MNYMEMLQQIFEVCELYQKYMDMLTETIINCVIATNQTYVDALKDKHAFTKEAQEEAFNMTYNSVLAILSDEAKIYLNEAVGDLDAFIRQAIEAQVKIQKDEKKETPIEEEVV